VKINLGAEYGDKLCNVSIRRMKRGAVPVERRGASFRAGPAAM
jgi:hypothetical protein